MSGLSFFEGGAGSVYTSTKKLKESGSKKKVGKGKKKKKKKGKGGKGGKSLIDNLDLNNADDLVD